jgi:YHS domain-containing protein
VEHDPFGYDTGDLGTRFEGVDEGNAVAPTLVVTRDTGDLLGGNSQLATRNLTAAEVEAATVLAAAAMWSEEADSHGRSYYFNSQTSESTWTKPIAMLRVQVVQPAPSPAQRLVQQPGPQSVLSHMVATGASVTASAWKELQDGRGRTYYFNTETSEARWEKPAEMLVQERAGGLWCANYRSCHEAEPRG